jgi:hypothetical protein
MKLRAPQYLGSVIAFSLALFVAFLMSPTVHATANNCKWKGPNNGNFNDSNNWTNCGGTVPQNDDNLVFDNSGLNNDQTVNNDMSLLGVGNITFTGNGNFGYIITGNTLTVDGNLTNSYTTNQLAQIQAGVNLTGALTSGNITDQAVGLNAIGFTNNPTVTFTNGSNSFQFPFALQTIANSGNIVVATGANMELFASSPGWNGTLTVQNGGTLSFASIGSTTASNVLGASSNSLVVNSGGVVNFSNIPSGTIAQSITVGGAGAIVYNPAVVKGNPAPQLTLSGTTTLTADTSVQVASGASLLITGPLVGNFHLTLANGSGGQLIIQSSNNQSATPNGTQGGSKAPGSPNTGFAALTAHPATVLIVTTAAALALAVTARRLRTVKS